MTQAEMVDAIRADLDRTVAETLQDPDLVTRSADYRDGYAHGFKEAIAVFVEYLINQKARAR